MIVPTSSPASLSTGNPLAYLPSSHIVVVIDPSASTYGARRDTVTVCRGARQACSSFPSVCQIPNPLCTQNGAWVLGTRLGASSVIIITRPALVIRRSSVGGQLSTRDSCQLALSGHRPPTGFSTYRPTTYPVYAMLCRCSALQPAPRSLPPPASVWNCQLGCNVSLAPLTDPLPAAGPASSFFFLYALPAGVFFPYHLLDPR